MKKNNRDYVTDDFVRGQREPLNVRVNFKFRESEFHRLRLFCQTHHTTMGAFIRTTAFEAIDFIEAEEKAKKKKKDK